MSRKGAAWTEKEDSFLLDAQKQGLTYDKINEKCKRDIAELKARVAELKASFEPEKINVASIIDMSGMEENDNDKPTEAKPAKAAARRMATWTTEEDERLIKELKEGKTMDQAAELHGRTIKAITMRMEGKVKKMAKKPIPEIVEATGLTAKQVGNMLGKAIDNASAVVAPKTDDAQLKLLTEIRDLLIEIRDQKKL
jgi:hypothetical protein